MSQLITPEKKEKFDGTWLFVLGVLSLIPGAVLMSAAVPFGIAWHYIRWGFEYGASVIPELNRRSEQD